ncbi:thaumatin-like protein 1b [Cucurbita pepo subsp. pepo]|uniref:thaumatin-like protein 1b n=1 Tax=Cucurbita pepo subsp. pepo TaxID=3664 RepID=UPI000C9D4510|nr:thaumatin-like protein 1b [Cucurbita pepo subsp. pepo]
MALQIPLLLLSFIIFSFSGVVYSVDFAVTNNCQFPIWPGALTGIGTPLSTTGFELLPGSTSTVTTSPPWSGRFWARTLCSIDVSGKFNCGTADCGSGQVACNGAGAIPPASLVEFTIAPTGGVDYFDISLVDGFNLPVSVTPMGGTSECQAVVCAGNVNAICPPELAVRGQDGAVIACKSACMAFNQPEFCCCGNHNQPQTCPPTNYSKMFKDQCPQAYSYAYDDQTSIFTCTAGANYGITFCP